MSVILRLKLQNHEIWSQNRYGVFLQNFVTLVWGLSCKSIHHVAIVKHDELNFVPS